MNISRENVDELTAIITLKIEKADYAEREEAALKKYAKHANVPGFRPGKAPIALIKRQFGKAVLADEVNNLIGETLSKYIEDNKLNIALQPLPAEGQEPIDFDKEVNDITFKFEVGLLPEINVDLEKISIPNYTIEVTDKDVEAQIKNLIAHLGTNEKVETIGEKSMIKGSIKQEGAFSNENAVISTTVIKDEAEKAKFIGKKVGDVVAFDIKKAYPNETEISYILSISKEEAANVKGDYTFTISEITEYKEAELNQTTFDQVFGKDTVKTVDEFKAKARESLVEYNKLIEEDIFTFTTRKELIKAVGLKVPEKFVKRWVKQNAIENKRPITDEEIEKEFPKIIDDFSWTEISRSIAEKNEIKVNNDDILAFAKKATKIQFLQYGFNINNIPANLIEEYAVKQLQDKNQEHSIVTNAVSNKIVSFIKEKAKLHNESIKRDDIAKIYAED